MINTMGPAGGAGANSADTQAADARQQLNAGAQANQSVASRRNKKA